MRNYIRMIVVVWFILTALLAGSILSGCSMTGMSTVLEDEVMGCSLNTDMEFLMINGRVQACYRSNSVYFVVDNTGTEVITGLRVTIDADYDVAMSLRDEIAPGETSQHNLNFGNQALEGVEMLEVYPMVGSPSRMVCDVAGVSIELKRC